MSVKSRAAIIVAKERVEVREIDMPAPGRGEVLVRQKNMTGEQLQAGYNRFTKDYYRMMEIVYRAFKQPNAVATITRLIANVGHRINCVPR